MSLFDSALRPPTLNKRQHKLFMRRTYSIFKGQQDKWREAVKDKKAPLPYTVDYLRLQAESTIGRLCRYCAQDITVRTLSLDHIVPLNRIDVVMALADRFAWENNDIECCRKCNGRKGSLTREEWTPIAKLVYALPPLARKDLLMRLSSVPLMFFNKKAGIEGREEAKAAPRRKDSDRGYDPYL